MIKCLCGLPHHAGYSLAVKLTLSPNLPRFQSTHSPPPSWGRRSSPSSSPNEGTRTSPKNEHFQFEMNRTYYLRTFVGAAAAAAPRNCGGSCSGPEQRSCYRSSFFRVGCTTRGGEVRQKTRNLNLSEVCRRTVRVREHTVLSGMLSDLNN